MKWVPMPTGRWATTMQCHGGTIVLHAFLSGAWAITRGQVHIKAGDPFVMGSREGLPEGSDLEDAMQIAERHAREFVDSQRPKNSATDVQGELF